MPVEIGTLVLKGRFGPQRPQEGARPADLEALVDVLRAELLREMDDRFEDAARRAWER